jgi:hypothetical protein
LLKSTAEVPFNVAGAAQDSRLGSAVLSRLRSRRLPVSFGEARRSAGGAESAGPRLGWVVLLTSGSLGFILGITRFQTWHVAVETAQVLAGLVAYPPDNPFFIYHTKLWTAICQACALLLNAGLSEIALSRLLSGLVGAVSFQAVSMLVYAFSRDWLIALGTPLLVLYARAAEHGTTYPIALMGTDHTYGTLGLSLIVLVVALFGAGRRRLGGFLLGLAPAVHPSLGAWLWLIAAGALALDSRNLRSETRPWLPYFAAGFAVTLVSFGVHLAMAPDLPGAADSGTAARHLRAFVTTWDDHRRPAPLFSVGTILNLSTLVVGLVYLLRFAGVLPPPSLLALRMLIVGAVLSICAMFVSWLPPELVPSAILTLMPSRFLNVNTLAFVPVIIGLLAVHRQRFVPHTALVMFAAGLLLSYRSMLWEASPALNALAQQIRINPWHVFVFGAIAVVVSELVAASEQPQAAPASSTSALFARCTTVALFAGCAVLAWRLPQAFPLLDRTNDPFFEAVAAEREGLLATAGSFHLVQLYTRRPVLVDGGALDILTYGPEGGPAMVRILGEVYGLDFFNPPPEARRSSVIQHRLNKPVWEGYSRLKWQEIGWSFNITQLLTRADWRLDLPLVAENQFFKLYRIPN